MSEESEDGFRHIPGVDGMVHTDPHTRPNKTDNRYAGGNSSLRSSDQMVAIIYAHPEPAVRFVKASEFGKEAGHAPGRPDLNGMAPGVESRVLDQAEQVYQLDLTETVMTGLEKITRLLNGETVTGRTDRHNFLSETPPKMEEILAKDEVAALHPAGEAMAEREPETAPAVEEEFGDKRFYKTAKPAVRKPFSTKYLFKYKRAYNPTAYGRALLQHLARREDNQIPVPRWEGSIRHRWGVGATALLYAQADYPRIETYYDIRIDGESFNVDVLANHSEKPQTVIEVVAEHNNQQHDIKTFQKTASLSDVYEPYYIFSNLERAKKTFGIWERKGLLPCGRKIDNLAAEPLHNEINRLWKENKQSGLRDFLTLQELHDQVYANRNPTRSELANLTW